MWDDKYIDNLSLNTSENGHWNTNTFWDNKLRLVASLSWNLMAIHELRNGVVYQMIPHGCFQE